MKKIGIFDALQETVKHLYVKQGAGGLLLIAGFKGNPMTIGWGTIGIIWKIPIFTVLVRPSRYTHELIEESGAFSVNVLSDEYAEQILYCGSHSGRDGDKIRHCGFTLEKGHSISIPHLKQASVVYECRIVHRNNVIGEALKESIYEHYYDQGDLHTLYFGEILAVFREE
jgi:flavin reductase (DIM6/NTAB) family NADH-FMN oxidoreductase RutF